MGITSFKGCIKKLKIEKIQGSLEKLLQTIMKLQGLICFKPKFPNILENALKK